MCAREFSTVLLLSSDEATSEAGANLDPHSGASGIASLPRTVQEIPHHQGIFLRRMEVFGILTCLTGKDERIPNILPPQGGSKGIQTAEANGAL